MLLSENKLNLKTILGNLQKVVLPLKLRKAKSGDFFQPKGMKGKKLVSKFFKDEKISILARQKSLATFRFGGKCRWNHQLSTRRKISARKQ